MKMSDLHKTNKNRVAPLLLSVCMAASFCSCAAPKDQPVSVAAPVVTSDKSLPGESKTTWDCVYFGSYPMSEVVESAFSAVDDYALREGDVITDPGLYAKLKNADWHYNECELDGSKFRRVKAPEDKKAREQHYQWDGGDYHYFRYEPIKWRVLEKDDQSAMLIADRLLDCEAFHTKAENVYWEDCTLRSFLNGYDSGQSKDNSFFYTAFSEEEQKGIIKTKVKNPDNHYFGTACGKDTEDYVFIPDEQEIFQTDAAVSHGFAKSDGVDDCARRFQPTLYAMAKGAWYSPVESNRGNGFWILRTSGYTNANVNYICDFGAVYNRGTYVTVSDAGILPAITVDLSKAALKNAGKVSSDEIFKPTKAEEKKPGNDQAEREVKKSHGFSEPVVEKDSSLSGGQKTTWDCLYFGSYPQTEIVKEPFNAVADYAVDDGAVTDKTLYSNLESANWTDNETELDGVRYRRMKAADAVSYSTADAQHYKWDNETTYHYFRYDPVKWRVLELNGDEAMLVADRELDCLSYHTVSEDVKWEDCSLRSFLNSEEKGFYANAFSEEEKKSVLPSVNENPDNAYYGTKCGAPVEDKVFILSSDEVFASPAAARHGFYAGGGVDDPARRFRPTMYAKARGTWYSPVDDYKGNGFWFMRTAGYSLSNITYICDFGYIYNRGTDVTCNDSGILPAVRIDLSKAAVKAAGTVTSAKTGN